MLDVGQTARKPAVRHEEIADPTTGLFSEAYLRSVLPTRVAAARRGLRPLGLALVDVRGDDIDPIIVSEAVRQALRDSDTPCRLDDGGYALILEDTPLVGSERAVQRVRELLDERLPSARHWAGVACYPVHAFGEDELLAQTRSALAAAHQTATGGLVVAEVAEG